MVFIVFYLADQTNRPGRAAGNPYLALLLVPLTPWPAAHSGTSKRSNLPSHRSQLISVYLDGLHPASCTLHSVLSVCISAFWTLAALRLQPCLDWIAWGRAACLIGTRSGKKQAGAKKSTAVHLRTKYSTHAPRGYVLCTSAISAVPRHAGTTPYRYIHTYIHTDPSDLTFSSLPCLPYHLLTSPFVFVSGLLSSPLSLI